MTRLVACAVVRTDPPQVFTAEDLDTLNWILALKLVAATPASELPLAVKTALRAALREERWGDAVEGWIRQNDVAVDVYSSMEMYLPADVEIAGIEMQFTPLFED